MIEIVNGLIVITVFVIFLYLLLFTLGVIGILLTNIFTSHHLPYTWLNIRLEGAKGLIILATIIAILIVAFMFGTAIKHI